MSDNLVKKPKKDEEEYEEEEDIELDDDDSTSSKKSNANNAEMKKRLFMLMGIIIGVTVLLLIILWIASLFTVKNYSYEDMETIMKDAAVAYFADYPDYLPQNEGEIVEVDAANLVAAGKMKDLSEYRNDGVVCAGNVQVENAGGEYLYVPYLNCGEYYYSVELYNKIVADNPTTKSGDGLYSNGRNYVFRGENVNNYVKLGKSVWRIVKITSDGNVVLIHSTGVDFYQPWDDRYNEEYLYEAGINTFNVSRMKEYLEKIYTSPNKDDGEVILSAKDKARIVPYSLCVGGRTAESESKNNTEECRQKVKNVKLGLLTLSDYMYASIDPNCKNAKSKSCMNYNYLAMDDEWWLVTPDTATTATVFKVERDGIISSVNASNYSKVRPVIYLNSRVMVSGGKGTAKSPYKVK